MPCWEVNLISVEFKVANKDLLEKTLRDLDLDFTEVSDGVYSINRTYITIDTNEGQVNCRSNDFDTVNDIKRKYSENVVRKVAYLKRWAVRDKGPFKLELRKH